MGLAEDVVHPDAEVSHPGVPAFQRRREPPQERQVRFAARVAPRVRLAGQVVEHLGALGSQELRGSLHEGLPVGRRHAPPKVRSAARPRPHELHEQPEPKPPVRLGRSEQFRLEVGQCVERLGPFLRGAGRDRHGSARQLLVQLLAPPDKRLRALLRIRDGGHPVDVGRDVGHALVEPHVGRAALGLLVEPPVEQLRGRAIPAELLQGGEVLTLCPPSEVASSAALLAHALQRGGALVGLDAAKLLQLDEAGRSPHLVGKVLAGTGLLAAFRRQDRRVHRALRHDPVAAADVLGRLVVGTERSSLPASRGKLLGPLLLHGVGSLDGLGPRLLGRLGRSHFT